MSDPISEVMVEVEAALRKAVAKHAPMHSGHEGYAVIREELDELWDEVKQQGLDTDAARKEALHVAAMGARFVLDICGSRPIGSKEGEGNVTP